MATASRLNPPGELGSATALHEVPPFVDRNSPSLEAARISAPAIEIDHVRADRRWVHVAPPLVETYNPPVVAASRCRPFAGSTTRSKKPCPTKGAVQRVDQLVPPSLDRRTPAPSHHHQFPSPRPQ